MKIAINWRISTGLFVLLTTCLLHLNPADIAANSLPYFKSFSANYHLMKNDDDRSQLLISETIIVEFAENNSNKGIVRELPRSYDGRPLALELLSVTRNGKAELLYEDKIEDNFRVISTGTDDYLHGEQTYVINYSYRDVIRQFDDHQELYWDVNGTGWRYGFDEVSARLTFDDEAIKSAFNGEVACYQGEQSSNDECIVDIGNDEIFYQSTQKLNPKETVTMVAGFETDTFNLYSEAPTGYAVRWSVALIAYALSIRSLMQTYRYRKKGRDHPGRGAIPVEYAPPKDTSAITASILWQKQNVSSKAIIAGLVELAVDKKLKIISEKTSSNWLFTRKKTTYSVKLLSSSGLTNNQSNLIKALYGSSPSKSQLLDITKTDQKRTLRVKKFIKQEQKRLVRDGYRRKVPGIHRPYVLAIVAMVMAAGLTIEMSQAGFAFDHAAVRFLSLSAAVISFLVVMIVLKGRHRPLTKKGRQLHDYLKGLEQYIKLAEAKRLQFAQSPSGAQKNPIDTNDAKQVIRLYESLLPYAILFGHEKEWYKTLSLYYEQQKQHPAWYSGSTVSFNAASFARAMSSISKSMSYHSNSSGLSGGSAGGGGGGGGGGAR